MFYKLNARKIYYTAFTLNAVITLEELEEMQAQVREIKISNSINELADAIVCELRRKEIAVSDRNFFNFGSIVQAEAWLDGAAEVEPQHLNILKLYFWNKPEEITIVREVLEQFTQNPIKEQLEELLSMAYESHTQFEAAADKIRGLTALRSEFVRLYGKFMKLKQDFGSLCRSEYDNALNTVEELHRQASQSLHYMPVPLSELATIQSTNVSF